MLQLSNSQKFAGNTWHLPWKKNVIWESEKEYPNNRFASDDDRNTFGFVCTSCSSCRQLRFALAFMSDFYMYLLQLLRIYDAFD